MAVDAMIVGVFNRPDHPEGYGFPRVAGFDEFENRYYLAKPTARAHGYVTLFVRCEDQEQLDAVARKLGREEFHGIDLSDPPQYSAGWLGEWFGGRFDLVATVPDVKFPEGRNPDYNCMGDNRMVAVFNAEKVLEA
jgi:hypothetical protein